MNCMYVGDSSNVINYIRYTHCSGDVEGSSIRFHIAECMGYSFIRIKRPSGSYRLQIDSPSRKAEEAKITNYIRSGKWRYVLCQSYQEAHDFQWYVIDKLKPLLNKHCETWDKTKIQRYNQLFSQFQQCSTLSYVQLKGMPSGPGVYVFYHDQIPRAYKNQYYAM